MTLVVETGTGISTADAYATIVGVSEYNTAYVGDTAWSALDSAVQERYIRRATQFLDSEYQNSFVGKRANAAQSLEWPRADADGSNGQSWDSDEMPTQLLQATAEAALKLVSNTDFYTDVTETSGVEVSKKEKVGPLEVAVSYVNPEYSSFFESIRSILSPLLTSGSSDGVSFVDRG